MSAVHNADPAELAKFGDAAHRWWDPESEFKPLHQINPLRLAWIDGLAPLKGQKVLDVGCGGGLLAEAMALHGAAEVLGIDLSTKALGVAELHAMDAEVANLRYREVAVETLAEEMPGHFDVVTCLEMLEHVPDPASVVRACARLVRPGGWVFFSTLHRNPKAFALAVVAAEYLLNMLPRGTHEYGRFIRPAELAGAAREAGLVPLQMAGLSYNPLTQRYAIGSDTDVNYLLACRRP
ncbi:bifunctional 2-polyprenyl-6-hydroxyphenol methylase/3-demethylubiquinol 3-O-methyltransferase UbiG [Inhella proteolytica]|uniref:Ubiquinone biosynthesis O-methyltransferase n=1 Tax=Inhella proteolytica TaxID=2795029 RepID=A0A931NFD0_9BURK|nr:bifunctional 2-polyprenyl-6-hydroxyphenol methylase/3-demethylubiquinol 3-O-methyltransferase UbiG [Inhella proteolytica]MBH9578642.1 bifunctional 2-polyprenyl-6-hydroxyphenol methylase/3-demethylubiquinol 3-O-methyltransferase UbiG [Inhella proteolytica]